MLIVTFSKATPFQEGAARKSDEDGSIFAFYAHKDVEDKFRAEEIYRLCYLRVIYSTVAIDIHKA